MKEYIIRTDADLKVENGRLIVVYVGSGVHVDMVKELPPHGELVSRDNILTYFDDAYCMGARIDYKDAVAIVSNKKAIPTIIEASK